jgi:chromosome segregation ATPase
MSAQRPGENLSPRIDRYDFERLERSVEYLLKDHERLSTEREALLAELIDREHRIAVLESKLGAEDQRRATAIESVDRILARLEALEVGIQEVSAPPGSGGG